MAEIAQSLNKPLQELLDSMLLFLANHVHYPKPVLLPSLFLHYFQSLVVKVQGQLHFLVLVTHFLLQILKKLQTSLLIRRNSEQRILFLRHFLLRSLTSHFSLKIQYF